MFIITPSFTYLIIQENEIHLDENERHSGGGRQCKQNIVAFGVSFQLEVLAELQARVNHASDTEGCGE